MPEQMVTVQVRADITKPVPGETSRTMPDQVGNVAGANMDELVDRLIATSAREVMPGPLKKVIVFWLGGMGCDGCTISTLGATEPSVEELITGALPGIPSVVLHHYAASIESGDHFTRSMELAEQGKLDAPYVIVYEGSIADENLTIHGEPWSAEGALPTWAPAEERRRIPTMGNLFALLCRVPWVWWRGVPGLSPCPGRECDRHSGRSFANHCPRCTRAWKYASSGRTAHR